MPRSEATWSAPRPPHGAISGGRSIISRGRKAPRWPSCPTRRRSSIPVGTGNGSARNATGSWHVCTRKGSSPKWSMGWRLWSLCPTSPCPCRTWRLTCSIAWRASNLAKGSKARSTAGCNESPTRLSTVMPRPTNPTTSTTWRRSSPRLRADGYSPMSATPLSTTSPDEASRWTSSPRRRRGR